MQETFNPTFRAGIVCWLKLYFLASLSSLNGSTSDFTMVSENESDKSIISNRKVVKRIGDERSHKAHVGGRTVCMTLVMSMASAR